MTRSICVGLSSKAMILAYGFMLCSANLALGGESPGDKSSVFRVEEGKHLDILRDGQPLVRYMFEFDDSSEDALHRTYKVYHHVFDPSGKAMLTKGAGGQFTHHRGIFIGFRETRHGGDQYDMWHMKDVTIVHQKFLERVADAESATVTSLIHWRNPQGVPILEETRSFTVYFVDNQAHLLADFVSTLKAIDGDVELRGDPEHAGIQYRPSDEVAVHKSARYTFHAEEVDPREDRDMPWVALTYPLGDRLYTVQQMRHPDDPEGSIWSAYRDYGRFGNYFVQAIPAGESLTVRYRFRITQGDTPSRNVLAAQYEKYVKK